MIPLNDLVNWYISINFSTHSISLHKRNEKQPLLFTPLIRFC